jgi:hypothetical protein
VRSLCLLLALSALALLAPTAVAMETGNPRAGRVVSESAALPFRMPLPPRFTIHHEVCPDYDGSCAWPETGEIWLPPGAGRFARWHELGHIFDYQVLTDADRAWFTPQLGFPSNRPWEAANYDDESPGFTEPAERFADAYAHCALRTVPSSIVSYGYLPGPRTHRRVCTAIALLGTVR